MSGEWCGLPSLRRRAAVGALCVVLAGGLAACDEAADPGPPPKPTTKLVQLELGVYGTKPVLARFEASARAFNESSTVAKVTVKAWPDRATAIRALQEEGEDRPDLFMATRRDLPWMRSSEANAPVDELLDSRGVDFSDDYSRDALEAFSGDSSLQCMPYAISPMVIYYNTDLIDFEKMAERELDVPARPDRWTFEEFAAAAQFADRPRRNIGGAGIAPTLSSLAPFIYSGGGAIFDDRTEPTRTEFSSGDTQAALEQTLTVLRDPNATLTTEQMERRTPLEWFKRGQLGMIAGFRDLVPELRRVDGLRFDVLPMPTLGEPATIGDVTGLCLSSSSADDQAAADLLEFLISDEQLAAVARTGEIVPARLSVATSDDFLQPEQDPEHAGVYQSSLRWIVTGPLLEDGPALEATVNPYLLEMMTDPVPPDLEATGEEIDEATAPLFEPPEELDPPSESP